MADEVQEVLRTTYQWKTFDLEEAKAGAVIGFPKMENGSPDLTDSENIGEKTGKLQTEAVIRYTPYSTIINGKRLWPNESGEIVYCDDPAMIGKQLYICTVNLVSTKGTRQATTRSAGAAYNEVSVLSSLEIRDTFAMYALQGLLKHCDQPQYFDDANIMVVCSAAYRWAQGMMQASADARALVAKESGDDPGEEDEPASGQTRTAVDVSDGTTTEKLLQNLIIAVDDLTATWKNAAEKGIAIVGSPEEEALPVAVESTIKEMPKVVIDGDPLATQEDIDGLRTHVTNAKDEIIEEMPESSSFPTDYAKQETLTNVQSTVNDIAEAVIDQ